MSILVYRSQGGRHWNRKSRRLGNGWLILHAFLVAITIISIPFALLTMLVVRGVFLPLASLSDRKRGR